jgi:uncharacterized protein DUF6134
VLGETLVSYDWRREEDSPDVTIETDDNGDPGLYRDTTREQERGPQERQLIACRQRYVKHRRPAVAREVHSTMFIGRRQFIGGLIGTAAGLTYAALPMHPARGALATPQRLRFKAYRGKSEVGTHAVTVEPSGNHTRVQVSIDLNVSAVFITLFAFKHECEEIWQDGRLASLRSHTDDNGVKYRSAARRHRRASASRDRATPRLHQPMRTRRAASGIPRSWSSMRLSMSSMAVSSACQ